MLQRRHGFDLAAEALPSPAEEQPLGANDLQRHFPSQADLFGQIDHTHAAAAEGPQQAKRPKPLGDLGGRRMIEHAQVKEDRRTTPQDVGLLRVVGADRLQGNVSGGARFDALQHFGHQLIEAAVICRVVAGCAAHWASPGDQWADVRGALRPAHRSSPAASSRQGPWLGVLPDALTVLSWVLG